MAAGLCLSLAGTVGIAVSLYNPTITGVLPGIRIVDQRYAIIEPGKWEGSRLPVYDYVGSDVARVLAKGRWTLLFVRNGCDECSTLLQDIPTAIEQRPFTTARSVCLIEIPPLRPDLRLPKDVLHAALSDEFDWVCPTPIWVDTNEGQVKRIYTPSDTAKHLKSIASLVEFGHGTRGPHSMSRRYVFQ